MAKKGPLYLIHRHDASRLHWDLRLEFDGVLKSWAVPKEPSTDPAVKRLAVQVEDHALSYGTFEGTIPEGHYGAGTVEIWDSGWFEVEDRGPDKIVAVLHGKRLKGPYVLVRTKLGGKKENWLFFRKKG